MTYNNLLQEFGTHVIGREELSVGLDTGVESLPHQRLPRLLHGRVVDEVPVLVTEAAHDHVAEVHERGLRLLGVQVEYTVLDDSAADVDLHHHGRPTGDHLDF